MALSRNEQFSVEELNVLPKASKRDWDAACGVNPTMYDGAKPVQWVLTDSDNTLFALADVFGGE